MHGYFRPSLAGCNDLEERARQALISSDQTTDPMSAQLKELKISEKDPDTICADINLKNELGAYTGFKTAWINTKTNTIFIPNNQSFRRSSIEEKMIYAKICTPTSLELESLAKEKIFGIDTNAKNLEPCDSNKNTEFCISSEIKNSDEKLNLLTNEKIGKAFLRLATCNNANFGTRYKTEEINKQIQEERYKITLSDYNPNKTPEEKLNSAALILQNIAALEKQKSLIKATKEKSRIITSCEFMARSITLKHESEIINYLNSELGSPTKIEGDDENYYSAHWQKEDKSARLRNSKSYGVSLIISF